MENSRLHDLTPIYDRRANFYGKARVYELNGDAVLMSYGTPVVMVKDSEIYRLWDGYSATTMRHVNEFLRQAGFDSPEVGGKRWWDQMPVTAV